MKSLISTGLSLTLVLLIGLTLSCKEEELVLKTRSNELQESFNGAWQAHVDITRFLANGEVEGPFRSEFEEILLEPNGDLRYIWINNSNLRDTSFGDWWADDQTNRAFLNDFVYYDLGFITLSRLYAYDIIYHDGDSASLRLEGIGELNLLTEGYERFLHELQMTRK